MSRTRAQLSVLGAALTAWLFAIAPAIVVSQQTAPPPVG